MSGPSARPAHPLAHELLERYRSAGLRGPVLEVAAGSGRNTDFLVGHGVPVVATRDDQSFTQLPGGRDLYTAALSTHGYLHGTVAKLKGGIAELRRVTRAGAPAFITLGSIKDARFGFGQAFDDTTFAPGDGDEAGIPHSYFDRDGVLALLQPAFVVDTLGEVNADAVVGRWAHPDPDGMWHWFVRMHRA